MEKSVENQLREEIEGLKGIVNGVSAEVSYLASTINTLTNIISSGKLNGSEFTLKNADEALQQAERNSRRNLEYTDEGLVLKGANSSIDVDNGMFTKEEK